MNIVRLHPTSLPMVLVEVFNVDVTKYLFARYNERHHLYEISSYISLDTVNDIMNYLSKENIII